MTPNPAKSDSAKKNTQNSTSEKQTESRHINPDTEKQTESKNINPNAKQHTANRGKTIQQPTTSENSSNTHTLAQTQTKPSTTDAYGDCDEDIPFYPEDRTATAAPIHTTEQTENQIENTVQATPNDTTEQTENTNTAESIETTEPEQNPIESTKNTANSSMVAKPDAVKIEMPALVSKYSYQRCYELLSELDEIQYGYSQTPQPLKRASAPMTEAEKQQAALKEEEERQREQNIEDYRNLEMLMLHCRYVNITLEEQAERYSMEHILELFPEVVTKFKRKYKGH